MDKVCKLDDINLRKMVSNQITKTLAQQTIFFKHDSITLLDEITKIVDTTFAVEHEAYGAVRTHELKKGGKDIPVTESNKREYVRLYVNYRWCHGIEQQFLALQKGFNEVVPQHHMKPFDERELELVIGM